MSIPAVLWTPNQVFILPAGALVLAIVLYFALKRFRKSHNTPKKNPPQNNFEYQMLDRFDAEELNCHVKLKNDTNENSASDILSVEICGIINSPGDNYTATMQLEISDITNPAEPQVPICTDTEKWQKKDSQDFCFSCDLGKLHKQTTNIPDWTSIAQINLDWLKFPRKGQRKLLFEIKIISKEISRALASTECIFTYENKNPGYIDIKENQQRIKTLAVALAFAVSASDNKMYNSEIETIKNWARANINTNDTSNKAARDLEKALKKTVNFFRKGNQIDIVKICTEITETTLPSQRNDIIELCLYTAQAKGFAAKEEIEIIKDIAKLLEIEPEKLQLMTEKILPIHMHQSKDNEIVLGLTSDMDIEETRKRLNEQYRKWNARVTNSDPDIQAQADQMLELIAETRNQTVK